MKYLAFAFVAIFVVVSMVHADPEPAPKILSRSKRNVAQFGSMIRCRTRRSAWDYNGYGCHCGIGGRVGGRTVDSTDRCCYAHDRCYERVQRSGLCPWNIHVYTAIYKRQGCTGCAYPGYGRCSRAICRCDSTAANCFARSHFNRFYKKYHRRYC